MVGGGGIGWIRQVREISPARNGESEKVRKKGG
jgi:hypothetical protein